MRMMFALALLALALAGGVMAYNSAHRTAQVADCGGAGC